MGTSNSGGHYDLNGRVQLISNEGEKGNIGSYTLGVRATRQPEC